MVLKSELPEFEDMRPLQEIIADCKNLQHNCRHIIETDFFFRKSKYKYRFILPNIVALHMYDKFCKISPNI